MLVPSFRLRALRLVLATAFVVLASTSAEAQAASTRVEAEQFYGSPTTTVVNGTLGTQTDCCGINWSAGAQLLFFANGPGSSFTAPFTVPTAGNHALSAGLTFATNTGIYAVSVDGQQVGAPVDTYASPYYLNTVDIGGLALTAGPHTVTVTVTGKNPQATDYIAAIDYLEFTQDNTPPSCGNLSVTRNPGGHDTGDVTITDAESGIASISNFTVTNGTSSLSAFSPGDHSVTATATKTTQGVKTHFEFDVTDVAGNTTHCA